MVVGVLNFGKCISIATTALTVFNRYAKETPDAEQAPDGWIEAK